MTNPIWGASELWKPTPKLTFSEREGRNTQVLGSVWKDNFEVSERVALWGNKLCRYMIYTFSVCKGMSNLIYACKFIRFKTVSIFTSFMDSTPTHSVFFCTWSSTRKLIFFFFFFLLCPWHTELFHSSNLSPWSDNAKSLTCWVTRELQKLILDIGRSKSCFSDF